MKNKTYKSKRAEALLLVLAAVAGLGLGGKAVLDNRKQDARIYGVEQSVEVAHSRLNDHDRTFGSLQEYLERKEGMATPDVQATRKTTAKWPWELGR